MCILCGLFVFEFYYLLIDVLIGGNHQRNDDSYDGMDEIEESNNMYGMNSNVNCNGNSNTNSS